MQISSFSRACACLLAIILIIPSTVSANGLPDGSVIKGKNDASLYYLSHGQRLAFPSHEVLQSWYPNLPEAQTISDTELASYPLRQNVTYRPGERLVSFLSDTTTYAVARTGILRPVPSSDLAMQLFGKTWQQAAEKLPVTLFPNYEIGTPVRSIADYRPEQEKSVQTIQENIRLVAKTAPTPLNIPTTPPKLLPPLPALTVTTDLSKVVLNQSITVTVRVSSSTEAMKHVEIYDNIHNGPIANCANTLVCSKTIVTDQAGITLEYGARATDSHGRRIETAKSERATVSVSEASSLIKVAALPTMLQVGEKSFYTFNANLSSPITSHKIMAMIPGESEPFTWQDCKKRQICSANVPFYRTTQLYSLVTTNQDSYQSAALTITVKEGAIPAPVLSIIPRASENQATLHVEAPSGPTIGWSVIVDGSHEDDAPIGICEKAACDIMIQFKGIHTYRVFTNVGGKLVGSNVVHLSY